MQRLAITSIYYKLNKVSLLKMMRYLQCTCTVAYFERVILRFVASRPIWMSWLHTYAQKHTSKTKYPFLFFLLDIYDSYNNNVLSYVFLIIISNQNRFRISWILLYRCRIYKYPISNKRLIILYSIKSWMMFNSSQSRNQSK